MNWESLDTPPPKFATARDYSRPTYGGAVAKIAEMLGTPLMPWQRYCADVAGESDGFGNYIYPLVVITVPRQSGKTTLELATLVHRCLQKPNQRCWHTAQTGLEAVDKWNELADLLEQSPLARVIKVRRAKGSESITFSNGSTLRPHPPKDDALHGKQSDLNLVDEAWSFDMAKGMGVIQAITPTQATRVGAQTVITSTAGTADSVWFKGYVDKGRAAEPGIAYFEWAIPEDVDPNDLPTVASHHPAIGHTIQMKALESAKVQMTPGEFARAYGNRWTNSREQFIPLDAYARTKTELKIPDDARVGFGAAVSVDRKTSAICAAAIVEGVPIVELIEFQEGTDWVGPRLAELYANHRSDIGVDSFGPSGTVADYLHLEHIPMLTLSTKDCCAAAAGVYDRIICGTILFRPNYAMSEAVKYADKRTVGDAWMFKRTSDQASIAPLEAATLAVRAITHVKPMAPKPGFAFAKEGS